MAANQTAEELPHIHDWYAIASEYEGQKLKLLIRTRYALPARITSDGVETRELYFLDVNDLRVAPPAEVLSRFRISSLAIVLKLGSFYFSCGVREPPQTAEKLIQEIEITRPQGEPLTNLERVPDGFLLCTGIGGYYYIRSSGVRWGELVQECGAANSVQE